MQKLIVKPNGWECTLKECPPGFFVIGDELCLKSEYCTEGEDKKSRMDVFCSSGGYFWGGTDKEILMVQPVVTE